jgi:hypothetical protein
MRFRIRGKVAINSYANRADTIYTEDGAELLTEDGEVLAP